MELPSGAAGEQISDAEGNSAAFCVYVEKGCISAVAYRATTCITLVGVCEHLCELVRGLDLNAALALTCAQLLALHPEIPETKHSSVRLALAALQSAAHKYTTSNQ